MARHVVDDIHGILAADVEPLVVGLAVRALAMIDEPAEREQAV